MTAVQHFSQVAVAGLAIVKHPKASIKWDALRVAFDRETNKKLAMPMHKKCHGLSQVFVLPFLPFATLAPAVERPSAVAIGWCYRGSIERLGREWAQREQYEELVQVGKYVKTCKILAAQNRSRAGGNRVGFGVKGVRWSIWFRVGVLLMIRSVRS